MTDVKLVLAPVLSVSMALTGNASSFAFGAPSTTLELSLSTFMRGPTGPAGFGVADVQAAITNTLAFAAIQG